MKAAEILKQKFGSTMRESAGVGATVPTGIPSPVTDEKMTGVSVLRKSFLVPVDRIVPDPDQPRKEFDQEELSRLAESLKTRGQLQPIRARWEAAACRWVVVVGERRFRAAKLAGLAQLQVVEVGDAGEHDRLIDQLVENALREDLKPIEQAKAYQTLLHARGWSHRQLAQELAIAPSAVSQALALLSLPELIQAQIQAGVLAPATAYEVAKLPGGTEAQAAMVDRILTEGLTRTEVVAEVRKSPAKKARSKTSRTALKRVTSRVWKFPGGTVTAELRRGTGNGLATLVGLLRAAVEAAESELVAGQGGGSEAA